MTDLARAADIVLPGSAWVEKDGTTRTTRAASRRRHGSLRPRRRAWTIGRSSSASGPPSVAAGFQSATRCARRSRRSSRRTRRTRTSVRSTSRGRHGKTLAAGIEPLGTLEVGLHVPGSERAEVGWTLSGASAAQHHPADAGPGRAEERPLGRPCSSTRLRRSSLRFSRAVVIRVPVRPAADPGYLSYISGVTLDDMQAPAARSGGDRRFAPPRRDRVALLRAGIFGRVRVAGRRRQRHRSVPAGQQPSAAARKIAGAVVFVFGLHTMGLLRIDKLYSEKRVQWNGNLAASPARSLSVSRSRSAGRRASAPSSPAFWRSPARRKPSVRASGCWRSTRWAGRPVPADLDCDQPVLSAFARIRRHYHAIEVTSGCAALRNRRADLHQPVHDHRPVPVALPADFLTSLIGSHQV
jgi:hypothetical protein